MALEAGTFVDDLVTINPPGTDAKNQGDDHLRLIKSVLKSTFTNATRAFRFPEAAAAKTGAYSVVLTDQNAFVRGNATGGVFTITLPFLSNVFPGFSVTIMKSDSSANIVTVDGAGVEKINGTADRKLASQFEVETYVSEGSEWKVSHASGKLLVPAFPAGTLMLFQQTTAPIGWTKATTHNNKALRVVTGSVSSAGATAFTSVFGSGKVTGSHVLTIAQMPAHSHSGSISTSNIDAGTSSGGSVQTPGVIGNTGGGGSHNHTLSLDLQYVDIIIASAD